MLLLQKESQQVNGDLVCSNNNNNNSNIKLVREQYFFCALLRLLQLLRLYLALELIALRYTVQATIHSSTTTKVETVAVSCTVCRHC